ncbi:MAG TPA: hypothetical protein VL202_22760 [Pararhizobium sp.]|uniref:hypothetical protein n=1 Tax=Pararhizobium sp. TaxID=1977563 RepID=UPI002BFA9DAA|nr:hypothetical protein [Pararhizobium sp.]HTO33969.1 hypothetical protein [Pararhizobium sp.]
MPEYPLLAHRHDVDAEWHEYALQTLLLGFRQCDDANTRAERSKNVKAIPGTITR